MAAVKRKRYFAELEDQRWFPEIIRQGMTDYLRFLFNALNLYQPTTRLIEEGLEQTRANRIIDLCSGAGGAIAQIRQELKNQTVNPPAIILTDLFPNLPAYALLEKVSNGEIGFVKFAVDAKNVPPALEGFRTIFSAFHHFDEATASAVLENAVEAKQGIGIFDGGDKNLLIIFFIIVFHPLLLLILTPFIRPFRWSRILFTYIIPLIPLCTIWDGIISILHLYSPKQMLQLALKASPHDYTWKAGKIKNRWGMNIAYLLGYPTQVQKIT